MELESRSLSPNYRFPHPHPSPSFSSSFASQLNFPEKMPEPEGETHSFARASKGFDSHSLMDLDFDLDPSWPLDQISLFSNPVSPIMVSSSDLPCSPLWVFSDDDRLAGSSGAAAGLRVSDYAGLSVVCNPKASRENPDENDDNRKLPPPVSGPRPSENPDAYCIIKERMTQALRYFKESTEQHVLAQVWAPVKNGNRYVLTTSGQPFVLGTLSNGLHQYRMASLRYMFSVDDEENVNEGGLGLPGRVFRLKLPEWTPNVQYYSNKEFSRRSDALHHNVRGSLALPVFEPLGKSCVGVIELIMTSQKINYAPEVDKVCKALEAVNLRSSDILDHPNRQICNEGRQNALAEILEILTVVCETHNLPLAQTWVPCRRRSVLADGGGLMKSCSSFDGSCMGQVCMSTTDVAFYVVDAHMWGFWEACAEHHLRKGQGVAGRAFRSQNSCFCRDITKFCKTDYPLVHYARLFGLTGCFAICLRSAHTANDDYVLEFFLPPGVTDGFEQESLLASVLGTMKQHFQSLKLASGIEFKEEGFFEIVEASTGEKIDSRTEDVPNSSKKQVVVSCDAAGNTNPEKRKKSERKRGKAEKTIGLDVLQQYFSGSLKDAAKSLGVCPTTMKRICRQHGISRWPSRKINKVNRSLTKLKRVIESVQGGEGTFGLTSLAASPLPVAVGSISWPSSFNGNAEIDEKLVLGADVMDHRDEHGRAQATLQQPELEETAGTPTSHGSCQDCPKIATAVPNDSFLDSTRDHRCGNPGGSLELPGRCNIPAPYSIPLGGLLVEDAGSSKDLSNLCPNAAEERFPGNLCPKQPLNNTSVAEERFPGNSCPKQPLNNTAAAEERFPVNLYPKQPPNNTISPPTDRKEVKGVTIKATYREDIIRFRISLSSGIVDLKEEVAKRLKLEVGTFDIKYLDDDLEWVLIACDADLQECADISRSSGRSVIRLLIHDSMTSLGSSCESSGEY